VGADDEWSPVREQFVGLSPDFVHMSALFIASHPRSVREAIERHRRGLDTTPVAYLQREAGRQEGRLLDAASSYLGTEAARIAVTDSTTMGVGLMYNGLRLRPGQEILTTEHDYYVTHESVRLAAEKSGALVRAVALYDGARDAVEVQIVDRLLGEVRPETRVIALTWVHSGTGLKLPLGRISEALERVNAGRPEDAQVLTCVDGVHGFGVEDVTMKDLGCDTFAAGCHKWLFGPRGTGILWSSPRALAASSATIPSFVDGGSRGAWIRGVEPTAEPDGQTLTPGGFKAYEHRWAVAEAFEFHREIGKAKIAAYTHELARQLKEGLTTIAGVTVHTPMSEALSSGIVCFDVDGRSPDDVVDGLRERKIVATTTPYAESHARLAPCIYNSAGDVERALAAVREVA
jgi:selenocysteine lyase/cysteine desulfurase